MEFVKLLIRDEIPIGYHLATCKEVEHNRSSIDSLIKEDIRLKDGYLNAKGEVKQSYLAGLKWKLAVHLSSRRSPDKDEITTPESLVVDDTIRMGTVDNPLLLSLTYACEHDDFMEVEELLKRYKEVIGGRGIFSERLHDHFRGTVLHNCARHGSVKTLAMLLQSMEATQFQPSQTNYNYDGDAILRVREVVGTPKTPFVMEMINITNYRGQTPLHVSAYSGHKQICLTLIDNGASIELKDESGNTALHLAAQEGFNDVVKAILAYPGAKDLNLINLRNRIDATPLHVAAYRGHKEICSTLLENGASMELKDKYGRTALYLAVREGFDDVVKAILAYPQAKDLDLINQASNTGATPLHSAAYGGHKETCSTLLQNGPSIELKDKNGNTALHLAVQEGFDDVVKTILAYPGVKDLDLINQLNNDGLTPFHVAAYKGHKEICSTLLQNGASIELKDTDGYTALHLAVQEGFDDVVKAILAYPEVKDLDLINQLSNYGVTPLHVAAYKGHKDVCSTLLQNGSSLVLKDSYGDTALHLAVYEGFADVVKAILAYPGAIELDLINQLNKNGSTPLHVAAYKGHKEICSTLLQNGPSLVLKDNNGDTALHNAAYEGFDDVVKAILAYRGAKDLDLINQLNNDGSTPLHVAAYKGHKEVCSTLLQNGPSLVFKDKDGNTPLHVVASFDFPEIIKALLLKRAFVDTTNCNEETPLHIATRKGHSEVVRIFLSMNPEFEHVNRDYKEWVNMRNSSGDTALHIAVGGKSISLEAVEHLVYSDARVDSRNCAGETPLHLSVKKCNLEVVEYLLSKEKVSINLKLSRIPWRMYLRMCDFTGETPLHVAVKEGHVEVMMKLLHELHSDDLVIRDVENRTALYWAVHQKDEKMMKALLDKAGEKNKAFLLWNLVTFHGDHTDHCLLKDKVREEWGKIENRKLLKIAAKAKDLDMAMELINKGDFQVSTLEYDERRWISENLCRKHSDNPALDDNLGRNNLAIAIAALLLNPFTGTPLTIGIFGAWGMGKSSTMLQVEEALLRMAVNETFKKPHSNQKQELNKAMDSMLEFSVEGKKFRNQVITELKKRDPKTNEQNMKATDGNDNYLIGDILPLQYQSSNLDLIKHLALTNRSKLFATSDNLTTMIRCFKKEEAIKEEEAIGQIPTILTVRYNAWHYKDKIEASAGLAIGVIQELENSMTPPQWMRMCCKYSWNSQRKEIIMQIILPLFLAIAVVFTMAIPWMAIPIKTSYKALALPLSFVGVCWVFFRKLWNITQPIAQTIMDKVRSPDHNSKLGYEKKVIDDIQFLKEQLCDKADQCWWIILGLLGWPFISTNYYMKGTWVRKQVPMKENFRIVVFIDDLDRCQEDTILELLSTINLILGACGINVVVGIDKGMVENAITKFYLKDLKDTTVYNCRELADKYIRKIIQLPIPLPEPSHNDLQLFIKEQIGKSSTQDDGNPDNGQGVGNDEHAKAIKPKKEIKNDNNLHATQQENKSNGADQSALGKESDPNAIASSSQGVLTRIQETSPQNDGKHEHHMAVARREEDNIEIIVLKSVKSSEADPNAPASSSKGNLAGTTSTQNDEKQDQRKANTSTEEANCDITQGGVESSKVDATCNKESFELVLANYSPLEVEMLEKLSKKATSGDNKSPREWKRFLNYHRLAWNILSQDPKMKENKYKGWQRKLILWIFVCWNWSKQMDEIIKDWNKLLFIKSAQVEATREFAEQNDDMPLRSNPSEENEGMLSLGDVINLYMEKKRKEVRLQNRNIQDEKGNTRSDSHAQEDEEEDMEIKMNDLRETLKEEYDLKMEFIQVFQQFRFYSKLDHLEINNDMKKLPKKKKPLLNK